MSGAEMMAIFLPILALALLGYFASVWFKDRNRSNQESHDAERMDTDKSAGRDNPSGREGGSGV